MEHVRRVVLGLGSNLGDRLAHLDRAVQLLRGERDFFVLGVSPIYETTPAGGPPQGDYLNAAVLIVTSIEARAILEIGFSIERQLGRIPNAERWAPRPIDVDLLWIEGEAISEHGLTVPHERLAERPFALRPLVDVAPDATDFGSGERFGDMPAASVFLKRFADKLPSLAPAPRKPK